MSEIVTRVSLKALFRFPFQGTKWQNNFIIGSLFAFGNFIIPIIPLIFVAGYCLQLMRQAIQGQGPTELPEWNDWGRLFVDGARMLGVGFIYLLPGFVVLVGGMALYFVGSFSLPVLTAFGQDNSGPSAAFPLVFLFLMAVFMLSFLVGFVLIALGAIPLPVATAHFAAKDHFGSAFQLGEWWPLLRVNKLGYLIAFVIVFGLYFILSFVMMMAYYTIILCFLVPFLAAPIFFYLAVISATLFGQTYRESQDMLAPAALQSEPAAA